MSGITPDKPVARPTSGLAQRVTELEEQVEKLQSDVARLANATAQQQANIIDLDTRVEKLEGAPPTPIPPIELPGMVKCDHKPFSYPDGQPYVVPAPLAGTRAAPVSHLYMCSMCGVLYGGNA